MSPAMCKGKPWVSDYTCGVSDVRQVDLTMVNCEFTDYVVALRENAPLALEAIVAEHFPVIAETRIINTGWVGYIILYATIDHYNVHSITKQ
jgi:hypothetical protein